MHLPAAFLCAAGKGVPAVFSCKKTTLERGDRHDSELTIRDAYVEKEAYVIRRSYT